MNGTIEEYIISHIEDKYGFTYNKALTITITDIGQYNSYSLYMELNNTDRPLMIGGEFETDEEFAQYIVKEIDTRDLLKTKYFIIKATDENNQT